MTDQNIPADDVREIIKKMHYHANHDNVRGTEEECVRFFARQLEALIPIPPTLADMTVEERRACAWMQADVAGLDGDWLIIDPFDDEDHAHVTRRKGNNRILPAHLITPRPDLPRMEWNGTEKAEDVPPNTLAVGSEWEDADALEVALEKSGRDQITVTDWDGDVYVWDANLHDWRDLHPIPDYAPFTILHTGREADQ